MLLSSIDAFELTWKTKEKRLLADVNFNFAENLVENSDVKKALNYFTASKLLYKNAAEATDEPDKATFSNFAKQTETRLEKIKKLLNKKNNYNYAETTPRIIPQRISDSSKLKYKIIKKIYTHQATEESVKITNVTKKDTFQKKRKRKLNEETFQFKAKKQKIALWTIEREKILKKFHTFEIDTDLDKIKF